MLISWFLCLLCSDLVVFVLIVGFVLKAKHSDNYLVTLMVVGRYLFVYGVGQ